MKNQQIVYVLGVHKSGTSLVAGVLKILGAGLRPDDHLLGANAGNPKRFRKNINFVYIKNDNL